MGECAQVHVNAASEDNTGIKSAHVKKVVIRETCCDKGSAEQVTHGHSRHQRLEGHACTAVESLTEYLNYKLIGSQYFQPPPVSPCIVAQKFQYTIVLHQGSEPSPLASSILICLEPDLFGSSATACTACSRASLASWHLLLLSENRASRPMLMQAAMCGKKALESSSMACRDQNENQCLLIGEHSVNGLLNEYLALCTLSRYNLCSPQALDAERLGFLKL